MLLQPYREKQQMKRRPESDWRLREAFEVLAGGAGTRRLPRLPVRFGPVAAPLRDLLLRLPAGGRRELGVADDPDGCVTGAEYFIRFRGEYSGVIAEP